LKTLFKQKGFSVADHCRYVSKMLTDAVYVTAPKKKLSSSVFFNFIEVAYRIAKAFTLILVLQNLKQARKEKWTLEEVQGQLEMDIKESWSKLATSKVGHLCYRNLNLDDIINAEDPVDIIHKGSINI
jgi:hypothetical protein